MGSDGLIKGCSDMEQTIRINVDHVTIRFNKTNMKVDNLKEYIIRLLKRQLMFLEFIAVKDVSFKVYAGEALGIVGANGSGKSTILKAVSGIIKPYLGSIQVNGSLAPLIELGAGFDQEMTARENILLNGCILGHTEKFMRAHLDEIAEFAGVQEFLDSPLKNYSSGMKARLGFSIATMVRPQILIVDEVLAVGDAAFQKKCNRRMQEMLGGGTTLLLVSHNINDIRRLCDRALWMEGGILRMEGSAQEVCSAYQEAGR